MRLAHPDLLWLLGLVPVFAVLLIWSDGRRRAKLAEFTGGGRGSFLVQHLNPWGTLRNGLLALAALAFLIAAAARPQIPAGKVPVVRKGRDVAVLLDVSASMLAEDMEPNRLLQARTLLKSALQHMGGDRVGLIAFAGAAYTQCPLTLDRSALNIFLAALDPDVVGQKGTGLANALRRGMEVVGRREDRTRVLLLLTDGEDHRGELDAVLPELREQDIRVVAVGLGSISGEPIPVQGDDGRPTYKRDEEGKVVMTRLEEATLRHLAEATDGYYVRATGTGAEVDAIAGFLDTLEEGDIEGGLRILYDDRYADFVAPALLLLTARGLLGTRRRKRRKKKAPAVAAAVLLAMVAGAPPVRADDGGDPLRLYEEGRLEEASARLRELQNENPGDPKIVFDLGNVAYRSRDYEHAVGSFDRAADLAEPGGALEPHALYNQGCAFYRAGQMEEAVQAFRASLLADPGDADAKANLEFVLKMMEDQQQQQDPQDQNQDQEDDQNQENRDQEPKEDQDSQDQDNPQQPDDQPQDEQEPGQQQQEDQQEGSESEDRQQQGPPEEEGMSPEDVQRLIDALDQKEKTIQAERLKSKLRQIEVGKDW